MQWQTALEKFATRTQPSLRWMLVGSAATALHQVPVRPGDVDILLHPATTDREMQRLSDALKPFVGTPASPTAVLDTFTSSPSAPWAFDGDWTFGRWRLAGTKVEVARIMTLAEPNCINETIGEAVWATRELIPWRGLTLPVVPLQVQLTTCRNRGLTDRADAIEHRLALTRG
ncbi:nucleotidyltransferase family protein [Flexivirga lutea]